jgi:hypothetical protein
MKFAVSVALVTLLLAMPLGCVLGACQVSAPTHPCCPRTAANFKCPYDTLDSAKVVNIVSIAEVPMVASEVAAPSPRIARELLPDIAEERRELYILNRILRI